VEAEEEKGWAQRLKTARWFVTVTANHYIEPSDIVAIRF